MTTVTRKQGEHIDSLLTRFNKLYQHSGIAKSYKDRKHYVKPSDTLRTKRDLKKRKAKSVNAT